MLLQSRDKIPRGVLTPSAAFGNVLDDMVEDFRLQGLSFSVKSQNKINK